MSLRYVVENNPAKGRRAASSFDEDLQEAENVLASSLDSPIKNIPPSAVANARRPGRWAASAQGGGFGPPQEDQRFNKFDDDGDDIMVIPDLEEVVEEDFTQQIAQAPNVQVNRVATFKELDSDLLRHAAFSTLDDIDLKQLTAPLVPEAEIREPDVEWKWDVLFTEISSELTSEWDTEIDDKETTP